MTEKQKQVIKQLPETGYNVAEAMRRSGYTKAGSRAGSNYAHLRKYLRAYEPDELRRKIEEALRRMEEAKDNSNYVRLLELQCKITGLTYDKPSQNVAIYADLDKKYLTVKDKTTQAIDNKGDSPTVL